MSFGKLYSFKENARSTAIIAIAKANGLDIELVRTVPTEGLPEEYVKNVNPLRRVPSFVGANGFILTECIAIAIYITSQNEKTTLLGNTKQDYASILRWMSFSNSEVLPQVANFFAPLVGRQPYNKKNVDDAAKKVAEAMAIMETHLTANTFLVGERPTLADYFVVSQLKRGFDFLFDKQWREQHPAVTRWFETTYNQPLYKDVAPEYNFIEEALKNQPPKKEKKEQKKEHKEQPKPKAKKPEADEEEPKPVEKAKHPLDALPRPTLALDDWKRKYSNEDTRPVALPWFWANYKPDEYSLWRVDYLYNDELTLTFMSSNLIGGFFARLEASRKFIFGCASVFGKSNDSIIRGAFVIRGDDAKAAFDVAPDYDSYKFTRLDQTKEEDREFINDMWSWDKPIVDNGKTYDFADGKVFK